jgi:Rieske Fe-S protein
MKVLSRIGVAVALVVGLLAAGTVSAAETTLKGTLSCAKCALKKADKCQDVLTVTDDKGVATEYWIAKNEAAEKAGHQCKAEAQATVTGEVSEKDGKKWIAASKIEKS